MGDEVAGLLARLALVPDDVAALTALARAYGRGEQGRALRAVLAAAVRTPEMALEVGRIAAGRTWPWEGALGQAPLRTALSPPPLTAPRTRWRYTSPHPDDRFGMHVALLPERLCLVAQSVVVGMRYVRLLALDTRTGRLAWEREEQNLFGPCAPFVLETAGGAAVAWAYAQSDAAGCGLHVEVICPATGALEARHFLPLPNGQVARPGAHLAIGQGVGMWPVHWTDSQARRAALFAVDLETGALRQAAAIALDTDGVVAVAGHWVTRSDSGLHLVAEGAGAASDPGTLLLAFASRQGAHVEGGRPDSTLFARGRRLYFYLPEYRSSGPGRVILRQHAATLDLDRPGAPPQILGEPSWRTRFLAVSSAGELIGWSEREGGVLWCQDDAAVRVLRAPIPCPASAAAMARTLVIRSGVGQGSETLDAIDLDAGHSLWCVATGPAWHQGPIPTAEGVAGISAQGVSWLGA